MHSYSDSFVSESHVSDVTVASSSPSKAPPGVEIAVQTDPVEISNRLLEDNGEFCANVFDQMALGLIRGLLLGIVARIKSPRKNLPTTEFLFLKGSLPNCLAFNF